MIVSMDDVHWNDNWADKVDPNIYIIKYSRSMLLKIGFDRPSISLTIIVMHTPLIYLMGAWERN
jgi:hypothetical protein